MNMIRKNSFKYIVLIVSFVVLASLGRTKALPLLIPFFIAHCDTEGGPVIQAAKKALETRNIDLVLIWIKEKDETELEKAFKQALTVRKLDPKAREMADRYFFETLVRIHRAGEGAPYDGIKPAGTEEPAIAAADQAVASGAIDELAAEIAKLAGDGVRERFTVLMEKKKHKDESVAAGREYVEAYVTFIHYVERLHNDAAGDAAHGDEPVDPGVQHGH